MERHRKRAKTNLVSEKPEAKTWIARHFKLIFYAIVLCAGTLYYFLDPQYKTGIYNDDALYVITAHDFWNTPSAHPLLEIKPDFPLPGLPMLLIPVVNTTKHVGRAAVIASVCSVFFLGLLVRRWLSPGQTLAVVALYAFDPMVARFSGIIMPDPFYRLMAIASFLLMGESLEKPTTLKTLGLGFVLGWGSLIRPEGVVLLLSVVGALALVRRGRKLLPAMLVPLVGWLIFIFMWFHARRSDGTEYGPDLAALLPFWRHHFVDAISFSFFWFRAFLGTGWNVLLRLPFSIFSYFAFAMYVFFLIGTGVGFRRLWKKQNAARPVLMSIAVFCLSFTLVHIFWHVVDARYFILLLPFALIFIVTTVDRSVWGKIALVAVLMVCANENGHAIYQSLWAPNPMNAHPKHSIAWLKQNTLPSTRLISNIAPTIDLYTKRPTSSLLNAMSVDALEYLLATRKFEYIVLRAGTATDPGAASTDNINMVWDRYRRWVQHYPNQFACVSYDQPEMTGIYRVVVDPSFVGAYQKYISAAHHGENKQYDQAFVEVNQCLAQDPRLGSATNLLGALYFMANDMKSAEAMFLKTNELLPDSPNAMVNLASIYNRQGKTAQALDCLNKGLSINALNGDAAEFKSKVENLKKLWERNDCELFIDFPHPSLYAEISK